MCEWRIAFKFNKTLHWDYHIVVSFICWLEARLITTFDMVLLQEGEVAILEQSIGELEAQLESKKTALQQQEALLKNLEDKVQAIEDDMKSKISAVEKLKVFAFSL